MAIKNSYLENRKRGPSKYHGLITPVSHEERVTMGGKQFSRRSGMGGTVKEADGSRCRCVNRGKHKGRVAKRERRVIMMNGGSRRQENPF